MREVVGELDGGARQQVERRQVRRRVVVHVDAEREALLEGRHAVVVVVLHAEHHVFQRRVEALEGVRHDVVGGPRVVLSPRQPLLLRREKDFPRRRVHDAHRRVMRVLVEPHDQLPRPLLFGSIGGGGGSGNGIAIIGGDTMTMKQTVPRQEVQRKRYGAELQQAERQLMSAAHQDK